MALALYDRVQQTGTANTTVSFTLSGTVTGFQSFSVVGNTNTTYYSAFDASGNWETGLGTYSTTGPTLTRTTIYQSSNSNAAVTFSGTVNVFVTYLSSKSVNQDASGNVGIGATSIAANTKLYVVGGRSNFVANSDAYAVGVGYASSGAYYLGANSSNNALIFSNSAGSEKVRFDDSGNVLVGTTTALGKFSSVGGTYQLAFHEGTGSSTSFGYLNYNGTTGAMVINAYSTGGGTYQAFYTSNAGTNAERMRIHASGGVSIGNTTDPGATNLSVTGTVTGSSCISSSDERLKTNWAGLDSDFVSRLADVKNGTFERISSGNREVGVSAQSLQKLIPEAVIEGEDGMLAVNYGGAALVAVIELTKEVKALQAEIEELKRSK